MKKFLTVLLALSVVFTYTVGTAFAYTVPADKESTLLTTANDAWVEASGKVDTLGTAFLNSYKESGDATVVLESYTTTNFDLIIKKSVAEMYLEEALNDMKDEIQKVYNAQITAINDGEVAGANITEAKANIKAAIMAKYDEVADSIVERIKDNGEELVKEQIAQNKASAKAEIAKAEANLNLYSTELPDEVNADGKYMSNKAIAKRLLDKATEEIEAIKYNTNKDVTFYAARINGKTTFDVAVEKVIAIDEDGTYLVKYCDEYLPVVDGTNGTLIPTIADEEKDNRTLAEEKAYQIDKVNGYLALKKAEIRKILNAALENATKADAKVINESLAGLDADFAALAEVAAAQINYQKVKGNASDATTAQTVIGYGNKWVAAVNGLAYNYDADALVGTCLDMVKLVDKLEAQAARMKAETGFNGAPVYDADAVDEALADDIENVYLNGVNGDNLDSLQPSEDLVKAEMNKVLYGDNVTFDKVVYTNVAAWEAAAKGDEYDDANAEKVLAIVEETKAAIRAAKTVADVDTAFLAGYAKYDAVATLEDRADYQDTTAYTDAVDKYTAKLEAELATKIADYGAANFEKDFENTTRLVRSLVDEYLVKAYDANDLATKYQDAANEIANLQTKAELKAEADAINKAVLALGAVTVDDEAKVLELQDRIDAFVKYKTLIGVADKYPTYDITTYVTRVKGLVEEQLQEAYNKIGTVTLDDEAAIKDLEAKVDAFVKNYGVAPTGVDVASLLSGLRVLKIDAVEKAIGAIDASANPLDVKAIEAAREAYDALGEYGIDPTMYHKLLSLENLAKDYMINAVEALKVVKNHSVAGKGYIKIAWSVKGDAAAADGYQIYRATKANGKYTKFFTTSKMTYKNTKSLKKGTKYFYKVRAYKTVDGVKYYSDWSNKAYRVAK